MIKEVVNLLPLLICYEIEKNNDSNVYLIISRMFATAIFTYK